MRCEKARSHITDCLSDTLPDPARTEVHAHLLQCSECHREFEDFRELWADLEKSPVPVSEMAGTREALIAQLKWRSNMRLAVKVLVVLGMVVGLATAAGRWVKPATYSPGKVAAHVRGELGATVTLVEYGDYECPPCYARQYHLIIDRLLKKHHDVLRYEFRHFPLTKIHQNALPAAMAAEAAGVQGRFWEMHKLLLVSHNKWARKPEARQVFVDLASQLGLDLNAFSRSLDSKEIEQRILQEAADGQAAGIDATPTFLLNGKKLNLSAVSFEELDQQVTNTLTARKK
jgi:protein-disulfide isomerase